MDGKYMRRALELAQLGEGRVNPNPLVGAVIVKEGRIIGEGYHEFFGGPHAEINAFKSSKESVEGATMYVTLEPCSHYGKTPPCAKAIIEKKIKKVVIGTLDPNSQVSGRGEQLLKSHGIEVVKGVLEKECIEINEIFMKYISSKKPFVIMKTAMTLDGKICTFTGDSKWITNEASRNYVHKIRNRVSAIMVGINTVLKDDPLLTCRLENGVNPIRVIIDSSCKIPMEARILSIADDAGTIMATTSRASKSKIKALEERGIRVIETPEKQGKVDLSFLISELGKSNIDSILLEGGSTLNYSALEAGIVDKVQFFIAPKIIGGENAKTPVGGRGKGYMKDSIDIFDTAVKNFQGDILIEGYVRKKEG